jgi:hypothetical protein
LPNVGAYILFFRLNKVKPVLNETIITVMYQLYSNATLSVSFMPLFHGGQGP